MSELWTDDQSLLALRMRDDGTPPYTIAIAVSKIGPKRTTDAVRRHLASVDRDLAESEAA